MLHAILGTWGAVEADFQQVYGVDLSDPAIRKGRTWRWFLVRLAGLLNTESRTQRIHRPQKRRGE